MEQKARRPVRRARMRPGRSGRKGLGRTEKNDAGEEESWLADATLFCFRFLFLNFASFSSGSSRWLPVFGCGSQARGFVKVGMGVEGGLKSVLG